MGHKFNPADKAKLDNPMRRRVLPADATVVKFGITPGSVVADIGCGTGYFTFSLARAVGGEGLVLGVDISGELLNEARGRLEQEREQGAPDNVRFLLSQENSLPLEQQRVDIIFMSTVLHELSEPLVFFQEVKRVLRNQGKVMIIEWKKESMEMGPPLQERLSVEQVASLLKDCGYAVQEVLDLGEAHYGVIAQRI